jgi:hypothetical protein
MVKTSDLTNKQLTRVAKRMNTTVEELKKIPYIHKELAYTKLGKFTSRAGKGLEGAVPDLISVEIIRNVLSPAFKQQQYSNGLNNTVDHLIAASKNEYQADPLENNNGGLSFVF